MSNITVWGRRSSANVQKVIWTLEELELAYDQISLGGPYGGLDDADYLALNPNGLVPVIRDGELVLWESNAIVRYLAGKYASGLLWPIDAAERALVDQWTDWTATSFQPAWTKVFWLVVRTPEEQRDAAEIKKALAEAVRHYRMLEARLAEVPHLGGRELSYADIVAGVSMYRWMTMPIDRPELPHVSAWHERLLSRTAFVRGVCVSYEELAGKLSF